MTTGKGVLQLAALLGILLHAMPGMAQTLISPDEFLDLAEGKTLSFYDLESGGLVGVEQFLSRTLSVWRHTGEPCVYGQITTVNGRICFLYDDALERGPICWWPFRHNDRLMVRLASPIDPEIQEARSITTDPISCPNPPIS